MGGILDMGKIEMTDAYGRVEKFQMMVQKNDALLQLKNEFGLELY